jgi:hypothetical protein
MCIHSAIIHPNVCKYNNINLCIYIYINGIIHVHIRHQWAIIIGSATKNIYWVFGRTWHPINATPLPPAYLPLGM